jgi:hypothetical protein
MAATIAAIYISIPTTIRVGPTLTIENGVSNFAITPGGMDNPLPVTGISINNVNANAVRLLITYASGGQTAGVGAIMYTNNQIAYSLQFSAEL